MNKFEILIAIGPDREKLVAEIWFRNTLIAEINQEKSELEIELYNEKRYSFPLKDFLSVIEEAKRKLTGT